MEGRRVSMDGRELSKVLSALLLSFLPLIPFIEAQMRSISLEFAFLNLLHADIFSSAVFGFTNPTNR